MDISKWKEFITPIIQNLPKNLEKCKNEEEILKKFHETTKEMLEKFQTVSPDFEEEKEGQYSENHKKGIKQLLKEIEETKLYEMIKNLNQNFHFSLLKPFYNHLATLIIFSCPPSLYSHSLDPSLLSSWSRIVSVDHHNQPLLLLEVQQLSQSFMALNDISFSSCTCKLTKYIN